MRKFIKMCTWIFTACCILGGNAAMAQNFKMAIGDSNGSPQWELGNEFAKLLAKKTNGTYKISLFPNSQLGSEEDTVNNAAMGILDFSILAVNNITPFSPTVGVLTLPYVIRSIEDAKKLTQGDFEKEFIDNTLRDANIRILGWTYTGFRVLTNSSKSVEKLSDLKGLVIRVPKNEIMIATYKAWGINPTPMSWSETFTALQQKVVHGQDNPYATISAMKFYEVQKYVTNIKYIFSLEPLIMSESVFQAQKPEIKKAIIEAGKEASEYSYQYLIANENKIKADLLAKGMQISEPADNEKEWIEQATKIWPKFYKSIGGKDKLDKVLHELGR